ncbi:MAG: bifunctional UDP-N-acetylglucosamine diphosphorylase/glucosamine-1-phosphate N-acetyltransferase GlmU [Gammaproteobacteria bacterium]|nr:bifunctional UDP-N-acetylglucosamine diphosphorylase/glucosamine-1-phosphate N-acetyltransferase GlmU [Gammaproteobacteria bacterium]
MGLKVIILAAGSGTRMHSDLPKILHPLGGIPLLEHVVTTAFALNPEKVHIVYGHGGEQVRARLKDIHVDWVEQSERLGTGHAVQQAMPSVATGDMVLVLYGDVPLIEVRTLQALIDEAHGGLALVSAELQDPTGYGRIVRDGQGKVQCIVEEKDASEQVRAIREINTGFLAAEGGALRRWLDVLDNGNAQGEYYLTDVIARAVSEGVEVRTVGPRVNEEILGVNNRLQLAVLERCYQRRQANRLMLQGVTLHDPDRFDLRGELSTGRDVEIDVGVVLSGRIVLGDKVVIGPYCVIRDAHIGSGTRIGAHCVIDGATVGPDCRIGPFARLRPETDLAGNVHIGNFVEIKKSEVGIGSKINHLSYVGDTSVGCDVNVGAGTITCNYDGANKYRTEIGDGAFIGSDTQLVAPVKIGAGATIGAGSTITRDAPPDELTLSRVKQETRKGWKRPVKTKKREV